MALKAVGNIRDDDWPSSILSSPVTRTHRDEIKIARWNRSEWEFISAIDRSVDRDMSMQTNPIAIVINLIVISSVEDHLDRPSKWKVNHNHGAITLIDQWW